MIEQATKIFAFFALLSYALGLVITNTYLYYSGVSEFELFRPRFVTTGLLAIALLAVSATGILALFSWGPSAWRSLGRVWRIGATFLVVATIEIPLTLMAILLLPLELARAKIGALALSTLSITLIVALVYWARSGRRSREEARRIVMFVIAVAMAIVVFGISIGLLLQRSSEFVDHDLSNAHLLGIYVLGMAASAGPLLVSRLVMGRNVGQQYSPVKGQHGVKSLEWAWLSLILGAAFVAWILLFAKQVFPRVPEQFGGSRTRLVQLVVDPSAVTLVEAAGIDFDENLITCRVGLLFHGSSFYLVRRPEPMEGQIVLTAEVVKGLIVEGDKDQCADAPA